MSTVHNWYRQILSLNSKVKVLMRNSWSCQTASQKTMIQLLNDADPKSKSFPFDTKTCRYLHTIFHSQNKKTKEWLEIVSASAPQKCQGYVWLATWNIKMSLRWLDTVFQGQYLPSLSMNYVAINKVLKKIATTVVLDKDENLSWSGLQRHRSCHSNEMTLLPILLAAVYLGTRNCSSKIVHGSFFLR